MTRLALLIVAMTAFGCSKPSEESCRKAIGNMQRLMGTDNLLEPSEVESEVRRCRGGSKRAAVECAIEAQTLEDLRHCDFYKVPANAPGIGTQAEGSAAGSAAAGSAAAGSAATGSATAGSAAAGSATAGSAAAGAATAGSASGSATGSGT